MLQTTEIVKLLKEIVQADITYSKLVTIVQTYTRADCKALNIPYDQMRHNLCDVRLVEDGTMVYNVLISPQKIPALVNPSVSTDDNIVFDGSDGDSKFLAGLPSNAIIINVPKITSTAYIFWLGKNVAHLSYISNAENNILGNPQSAMLVQQNIDSVRTLSLINTDHFNAQFNNGSNIDFQTDATNNMVATMNINDEILLKTTSGSKIHVAKDQFDIVAKKISIHNDTISLIDILNRYADLQKEYFQSVQQNWITSGGTGFIISPTASQTTDQIKNDQGLLFN